MSAAAETPATADDVLESRWMAAWPAALGGQYLIWEQNARAFLFSEAKRSINAFLGSPAVTDIATDYYLPFRHPTSTISAPVPHGSIPQPTRDVRVAVRGGKSQGDMRYRPADGDAGRVTRRTDAGDDGADARRLRIRSAQDDADDDQVVVRAGQRAGRIGRRHVGLRRVHGRARAARRAGGRRNRRTIEKCAA